jgi:hypothetical protein
VITEPEMAGQPEEPGDTADVVSGADARDRGRWPWLWVFGTVLATSAVWALTLHGIGYGHDAAPDLHHYRLTGSPCAGDDLQPLTDAFGTGHFASQPAQTRQGPTLDQTQCVLDAQGPAGAHWEAVYTVTVTVELHKKTDPAAEFVDRNRPHGPNLDPSYVLPVIDETDRVSPVPHLGDRAYLLTGDDRDRALTVLHGGAVFTLDLAADEQWAGPGALPPDALGYPQQPPGLSRFDPALTATMRHLMAVLSA